jgi:hypothetical protein
MGTVASAQIVRIEFNSLTRGFQKNVIVTPDSVVESVDGRQQSQNKLRKRKNDTAGWQALLKSLTEVDLQKISKLEPPSRRSAFDGARQSTLKIVDSHGNSYSHTFDDENPNDALKPLMDEILRLLGEPSVR